MGSSVAMSGSDTISINGKVLNDLADGDCVNLEPPNDIASVKTGKNGNSIYSLNETGKQMAVTIRVLRGTPDDRFLNGLLVQQQSNFAGFVLMNGEFVKKIGDGKGAIKSDTYLCSGGIFTKLVPAKNNVEGDSEQSVAIYMLMFSNAPRAIT